MFESMVELFNEGKAGRSGDASKIGCAKKMFRRRSAAPDFVRDIMTSVPTSVNVKSYANIVREKAVLRRLIKVNEEIENLCYGGRDKLEDILAHTEKSVFDLLRSRGGGEFVPIRQVALNVLEKIEAASKSNSTVTGIPTGFIDLDYRTSGFQPSDFILIAARPSMGKTAFVLNVVEHVAVKRASVHGIQPGNVEGTAGQPYAVDGVECRFPEAAYRYADGFRLGCRRGRHRHDRKFQADHR